MKKFLNWLASIAEWAGGGDHFVGFVRIVVVSLVAIVGTIAIYFVVINIVALVGLSG